MSNAGDADAAYIVIEGSVEISVPTPSGPIVVNTLGKNELTARSPSSAGAAHRHREGRHALGDAEDLQGPVHQGDPREPGRRLELIKILAGRLANTTSQLTRTRSGGAR
jgi:hypothetical protein